MAKPSSAPRRKAPERSAAGKSPSLWVVLLCFVPVILLIWFLMHLEAGRDEVRRADTSRQRKPAVETPQKSATPKYDFYKELPKGNASRPTVPEKKPAEQPPKPPPPKSEIARANTALRGEVPQPRMQYFLQAGSFRKVDDAEQLRAQLALLGQVTRLEQGKVGGQTWHRVMIGPFASQEQMGQAKGQLAAQGFKQLLPQKRQVSP